MSACGLAPFVPQACDLSFTCRLFVACVASVSAQVCRESWDEGNSQFSTNLCGNACYAGYKQSYVRHETKPPSLPELHLKAHLTARLWTHGLWLGRRKDEVSTSLHSPSLSLLRQQQFYVLNSSDVLVLRRVHSKSKGRECKRGRWNASTMVFMSVKVVLHVATNIPELPGKQRHPVTSKSIWRPLCDCTGCGYNSGTLIKLFCPQSEKETSVA